MSRPERSGKGPFRPEHVNPGDRYELSQGHAVYCAPTGGDGARRMVLGAEVLDTDPAVTDAGVDAGYRLEDGTLRAPDVSVGHVPDTSGWLTGAPPLALEYASVGQDEVELQRKIVELLDAGTRIVWVVRLVGPRRVEVYEGGRPVRVAGPGAELLAPGILRNPVLVDALYDRSAAHEATLRNLLQRRGYDDLEQVRQEGLEKGREEGRATSLREAARALCDVLDVEWTDERDRSVAAMGSSALAALVQALRREHRWPD